MDSDAPVVVYDANVLFPFHVGHILTFMAFKRLVSAKWTEKIQTEWLENIARSYPEDLGGCKRRCSAMNRAVPDAMVVGFEHRIEGIVFHDPDDRHVIAAAIHANAIGIVTRDNDFSNSTLKPFDLLRFDPDDLLVDCLHRYPQDCVATVEAARMSLTRTKPTRDAYFTTLESQGLVEFVLRLRG